MVEGGDFNKKILYIHEDTRNPPAAVPLRPCSLLRADEFSEGRNAISPRDLQEIYLALDEAYRNDEWEYDEEDTGAIIDALAAASLAARPPKRRGAASKIDPRLLPKFDRAKELATERRFKDISLPVGEFRVVPQAIQDQREYVYIVGPSGIGKSSFSSDLAEMYHRCFPRNKIYLISTKKEDKYFDRHDYITRIELDPSFLEGEPLKPKDFKDSLVIFDDWTQLPSREKGQKKDTKIMREVLFELRDNLAETGRSENVYIIETVHLGMDYKDTRVPLNEADSFVIYPKLGTSRQNRRLLEEYIGLENEQIKKIMNMDSRWVFIKNRHPRYVVSEHEVYIL